MWSYFEAKSDDLMKEGAHLVEEVSHGVRECVALACLKGVIGVNGEVSTRKLLLEC